MTADETGQIDADSSVKVIARATSDGGLSIVADLLTAVLEDYQYTTNSGRRDVKTGQLVRLADDWAGTGVQGGV